MSRNTTHKSGEVAFDGKLLYTLAAGLVSANATTRFFRWVAPCDGTIIVANMGVIVQPTNAAAVVRIGLYSDTDSHLDDKNIQNIGAAGTIVDLLADALFVLKTVNKGDILVMELTNADTTGELAFTIVVEPRASMVS